jgi:hypothetical protein
MLHHLWFFLSDHGALRRSLAPVRVRLLAACLLAGSLAGAALPAAALADYACPAGGLRVELWADPPAGSLIPEGHAVRLWLRPNAGCYVTLLAVDTEGRIRLVYPGLFDDGWVPGGASICVPGSHGSAGIHLDGPQGSEYFFALASLDPMRTRFPEWLLRDCPVSPAAWEGDEEAEAYDTGWIVGDPFYGMRSFCTRLVAQPGAFETYCSAYVLFDVGQRAAYPRYLCSDCHGPYGADPYGPACPAVSLRWSGSGRSGWIDFHAGFLPLFHYEIHPGWHPRHWDGPPRERSGGFRHWSSADGRREIHRFFRDAVSPKPPESGDLRVRSHGAMPLPGAAWSRQAPERQERGNESGGGGVHPNDGRDRPRLAPPERGRAQTEADQGHRTEGKNDSGKEKPFHRFR